MAVQGGHREPVAGTWRSLGLELAYSEWGDKGSPPLVLLHGVRDHGRSWDQVAQAFSGDWRVVAPDLRGHGDSQWSPDSAYIASYHVLDLALLVEALGPAPVTIVAHSFGANVAARFTAAFPERVAKLVMIDGMGPAPKAREEWARRGLVRRTRDFIEQQVGPPRRKVMASLDEATAKQKAANPRLSDEMARHIARHGVRAEGDGFVWKYDPKVIAYPPEDFAADDRTVWAEVTVPTLLCWGRHSWTNNPAEDGRAELYRDHRMRVFDHAGHWVHHDQFDDLLAELRDFL
jgi:pimeloyl-ACP methyl ester carboxylesterase